MLYWYAIPKCNRITVFLRDVGGSGYVAKAGFKLPGSSNPSVSVSEVAGTMGKLVTMPGYMCIFV